MFLQKAMKQGRNVHGISRVMHAQRFVLITSKGCGHIVWVTCLLRFCVHPTALLGRRYIGLPSAVLGQLCEIKVYIKCCSDNQL